MSYPDTNEIVARVQALNLHYDEVAALIRRTLQYDQLCRTLEAQANNVPLFRQACEEAQAKLIAREREAEQLRAKVVELEALAASYRSHPAVRAAEIAKLETQRLLLDEEINKLKGNR